MSKSDTVFKKVLDNGLTVLVRPNHTIPKVSIQLWYDVGSKDEKTSEKGIAHLIEHMIFKGTHKLSESDINMITQKLSGTCNAFTSWDYTGYLFDFPTHHWHEALPIMADCMRNCTFKQELLNSEMKAVIQELKMYRDNYDSSLIQQMISTIFADHPYHYPIIGFKQDLWSLKHADLMQFYKKHYYPNNATLVVVGDVAEADVLGHAQRAFGQINPDPLYKRDLYYHTNELIATQTTLYRDVKIPQIALCFIVPGAHKQQDYFLNVLSWVLGSGKSSRLQKKLIDELQLVTQLESFVYDLFDYGLFFIYFQPKEGTETDSIITIIQEEIEQLIHQGITDEEIIRATKQVQSEYLDLLENNQKQAYTIGQSFLATRDENYLFRYIQHPIETVKPALIQMLKDYFKSILMHQGRLLPLPEQQQSVWLELQQESDKQDTAILSQISRESAIEPGVHVHAINVKEAATFDFPKPQTITLPNGLTILYYHNPNIAKIDVLVDFKAKSYYDSDQLPGLLNFMSNMLIEGTKQYSAIELAHEIESRGMNIESKPGIIAFNMLSSDLPAGLSLLKEILTNVTFPESEIDKVRDQLLSDIHNYWDQPSQFVNLLARKEIYKSHPYSKLSLGTQESLEAITHQDLIEAYKRYITPEQTTISIVGNLQEYDIPAIMHTFLSDWQGPTVTPLSFGTIPTPVPHILNYPINRDQVVLAFAGKSVSRLDPAFDKLLIFDQIFTGGVLGAMNSRLFALRERSGLFYTIGGSLLSHADEQPGMSFIRTIVSQDRLEEAQKQIAQTINEAHETISDDEYFHAQNALANSLVDNFETNKQIAATFLFMHRYKMPYDFFDNRAQQLARVSKKEIQAAVADVLDTRKMVVVRVGRV